MRWPYIVAVEIKAWQGHGVRAFSSMQVSDRPDGNSIQFSGPVYAFRFITPSQGFSPILLYNFSMLQCACPHVPTVYLPRFMCPVTK